MILQNEANKDCIFNGLRNRDIRRRFYEPRLGVL